MYDEFVISGCTMYGKKDDWDGWHIYIHSIDVLYIFICISKLDLVGIHFLKNGKVVELKYFRKRHSCIRRANSMARRVNRNGAYFWKRSNWK